MFARLLLLMMMFLGVEADAWRRVSCGQHNADKCSDCPAGQGARWCNGECSWCYETANCYPKGTNCKAQAEKERKEKEAELKELKEKVDNLVVEENDNSNQIKKIEDALAKLTKSVKQMSSKDEIKKMEDDLAKITNSMKQMTSKYEIKKMEDALAKLTKSLRQMSSKDGMKKMEDALAKLTESMKQMSSNLAKQGKDIVKNSQKISSQAAVIWPVPGCSRPVRFIGNGYPTKWDGNKSFYGVSLSKWCEMCYGWDTFLYIPSSKACGCRKNPRAYIYKAGYTYYKYI